MPVEAVTIGSKIFVFVYETNVLIYNLNKDEWSEKSCEATKNIAMFSCAKLPEKMF